MDLSRRAILLVTILVLASVLPLGQATVFWSNPNHALTPAMNQTLANNTALAQGLIDDPPIGTPLLRSLIVAERALMSRRGELSDDSPLSNIMRRSIDAELANLDSALVVDTILATPAGTSQSKALAVAREGLASRAPLLDDTTRLADYVEQQGRNVDLVEDLATTSDPFAIAAQAASAQAEALAISLPTPPALPQRTPSQALQAFMAAKGVASTPTLDAELVALDDEPFAAQLQRVVDAYASFDAATQSAFATGDSEALQAYLHSDDLYVGGETGELPPDGPAALAWNALGAAGVDLGPVLATRAVLLSAAADLATALNAQTPPTMTSCSPTQAPLVGDFRLFSIDMTSCPNQYHDNVSLTIDWRGNDVAWNNAGGNKLNGTCEEPLTRDPSRPNDPNYWQFFPRAPQAAALFDFGGNDYREGDPCGFAGGASLGAALLVDIGGNDHYVGKVVPITYGNADGEGTNGGGHAGVGFLLDSGGNDVYRAGAYAVNGGALVGLGMLIDAGISTDEYTATFGGVNGGASVGAAFLYDGGGQDAYTTEARAANGGALGGVAVLYDAGGNDLYHSTEMISKERYATSTIGGAHYGVGLLYDAAGDDRYEGGRDGSVGGGVDGLGLLIDVLGTDYYEAQYNGTIGGGWSLQPTANCGSATAPANLSQLSFVLPGGLGMLVEMEGDDDYYGYSFATVGGAYIAASFFVDASGNDDYYSHDGGGAIGGTSGHNRGLGVAFLMDRQGDDEYTTDNLPNLEPYDCPVPGVPGREFDGKGGNGGAAHVGGVGFLLDASGRDIYKGNSTGINGGAADGAIGMLIDAGGRDDYIARDRGVNGGAYAGPHRTGWQTIPMGLFALGFLIDAGGDDHYNASGNSSVLADGQGRYRDTVGHGVNGGGHRAMGFLYDGGGTDDYLAWGLATNGGGLGGVGLLFDAVGAGEIAMSDSYDSYSMYETGNGTLHASNGAVLGSECAICGLDLPVPWYRQLIPGGIGLLVDMGGSGDWYEDPEPNDYGPFLRDYSGDGPNTCVFPKGEPGVGHQRDVAIGIYPDLRNGCGNPSPFP